MKGYYLHSMNLIKSGWIILIILTSSHTFAQSTDKIVDNINWQVFKFSFLLNDQWSFDLTPIHRFNKNFTNHLNSSIDFTLKRKLNNGFQGALISRTFFTPSRRPRQFVWFDLAHKHALTETPFTLTQRVRYHWGLNINENDERDFIRYIAVLSFPLKNKKWRPNIAIEPWFRLNGINYIERVRYELGIAYRATESFGIQAKYWREAWYGLDINPLNHIWVIGLQYKFLNPLFGKTIK